MFKKFFTIVIVPRRTSSVRKIRIRSVIFGIGALLLAALISAWVFMIIDYVKIRRQLQDYEAIQEQYRNEARQLEEFVKRYEALDFHFENLAALNFKLKQMTRTRSESPAQSQDGVDKQQKEKIELARKQGILEVIASDPSEVDAEMKYGQETRFDNLVHFFRERPSIFTRIPSSMPVKGYLVNVFGTSSDPFSGEIAPQDGIDIATRAFHPVHAPAEGIVFSLTSDETYGNLLVIDHGNGFVTRYGHLARFEVNHGDIVRKGSVIAQTGNTGHTTRPRLHYEVLLNGIPQNPVKYLLE